MTDTARDNLNVPPHPLVGLVQPDPPAGPILGLVAWNVNGIVSKLNKIVAFHVKHGMPHVWCFQETKCSESEFPKIPGYVCHGSPYRDSKHHGVAVYVRREFSSYRIDIHPDLAGHAIAVQIMGGPIIVSAYVKNSGTVPHDANLKDCFEMCTELWGGLSNPFRGDSEMGPRAEMQAESFVTSADKFRTLHDELFWHTMQQMDGLVAKSRAAGSASAELIIAGDMNTCLHVDDQHGNRKDKNVPGLRPYEAKNMKIGMDLCHLHDTYAHYAVKHGRKSHEKWTFWSSRYGKSSLTPTVAKPAGNGWRLDYILAQRLIYSDVKVFPTGETDHSPIGLYF